MNSPYEAFVFDASKTTFPVRPHWHYFMEIIYMKEGQAMFECDGTTYVLEKGDLIIFYPESVHAVYAVAGFPIVYDVLKFDVNKLHAPNSYTPRLGAIIQAARANSSESSRAEKKLPVVFREEKLRLLNVAQYFDTCIAELATRHYGYDIIVHNDISALLIIIIRLWYEKGFSPDKISAEPENAATIRSITAYIDEHSGENIRVEDLADKCDMSYSFFAKSFHDLYGRSCKEYIELMRVTKAEDMLLFTSHSLSWIAQETGFSDSSHLIKTFRRWKDSTPKQFRLDHRVEK
jgi:AraC-like DNA-binding protein